MQIPAKMKGVTLFEMIVALLIVLGVLAILASTGTFDKDRERLFRCLETMGHMQNSFNVWLATTTPNNPNGDIEVCRVAKATIDAWNQNCSRAIMKHPGPSVCE